MSHVIESAPTGRAKCRGCGRAIAAGDLRFGERLPNPFGGGEMTLWFHPRCGAYKRPEPLLEAIESLDGEVPDGDSWAEWARPGIEFPRLPRIHGASRAPSGRARCRSCREMIEKGGWRIELIFYQEGIFEPSGFIHLGCARDYFETPEIMDRVHHFSELAEEDLGEIAELIEAQKDSQI